MRNSHVQRAAWLGVVALVSVSACSSGGTGNVGGITNDGGANDGSITPGQDASTSTGQERCPVAEPTNGAPCSGAPSRGCEYGTGDNKTCNALATCVAGAWQIQKSLGDCVEPTIATTGCPSTKADKSAGEVCNLQGYCRYPDGICGCIEGAGGGELDPDAAPKPKVWTCYPAGEGCPYPRPRVGAACTGTRTCDYGSCTPLQGLFLQCRDGAWVDVPGGGCPS